MSIHRTAARRDANEPTIRKRFASHGWHTEQMSGAGWPDLMCWPHTVRTVAGMHESRLVDVKMPDGKVTKPQEKKWKALRDKGIPVYVVRTEEDVDALVSGDLAAWEPDVVKLRKGLAVAEAIRTYPIPEDPPVDIRTPLGTRAALAPGTGMSGGTKRGARPGQVTPRGKGMRPPENGSDRLNPCGCKRSLGRCEHSGNYTPPCSTPMDAAKEAEETFAPPLRCTARGCSCLSVDGLFCKDHAP